MSALNHETRILKAEYWYVSFEPATCEGNSDTKVRGGNIEGTLHILPIGW
jgi:hypothetical protein